METATVKSLRDFAHNLKFTLYATDPSNPVPTMKIRVPLMIVCDNSLNIIDDPVKKNVIWDDDKERLFYFDVSGISGVYNEPNYTMAFGNKPSFPGMCIMVDYGEIQNMRIQFNEEVFDKIASDLSMPADQKEAIKKRIFDGTDQEKIIKRKMNVSYNTGRKYNSAPSNRHYDDNDEYFKTIHAF